jgi:uncharacterized protein (UPF0333 family)
MAIATGIAKQLRIKKEVTFGVLAGATLAQSLRRVSSTLSLKKETYSSSELSANYQVSDFRHGAKNIGGTINGELSPLTYQLFIESTLRKLSVVGGTTAAQVTITAAAASPQFVRSAGSWITDGHKVGDVIRFTGWTTTGLNNNTRNFLITALTALNITGIFLDGTAVAAKVAGDSVSCSMVGKKTYTPLTGHTDDSYNIEHWHSDIAQSEVYTGCKMNGMSIKLPPSGMAMIDFDILGKDVTNTTAAYFTSPTSETSTGILAAANGAVYVGGVQVATLTGLEIKVDGGMSTLKVVGSNSIADIAEGRVKVTGQMSVYFENAVMRDYFTNETEVSIIGAFTTGSLPTSDFMTFVMNRVKIGGADKDDGEKGIVMTMPFTALLNTAGGAAAATDATTLTIQDSQAV